MKPELLELLEKARKQVENHTEKLKDNAVWIGFETAKKDINQAVANKNPLVKEYINIHREAEKDPNSTIGRMALEMRKVITQMQVILVAKDMCKNNEDKIALSDEFIRLSEDPALKKYGQYLEGLKYLAGVKYEVSAEVKEFFKNELVVSLQEHDSKYEKYRLGFDEYIKRETERLTATEAKMKERLPEIEKELQELDAKERANGTMHKTLLEVLDEEIALKKELEEFERTKDSMSKQEADNKRNALEARKSSNESKVKAYTKKYGSEKRKNLFIERDTLVNDISRIPMTKDELEDIKHPPEIQEKVDEYQKVLAPLKAREMFAKQAIGLDRLTDVFIGDYLKREGTVTDAPFSGRHTPGSVCVAMMLLDNYKLEDIMNPTALLEEKKKYGQEYIKHRQAKDVEWYVKTMYDGGFAMMNAFKQYVIDHKDELKTEKDLMMHVGTLGALGMTCYDIFQELKHCKQADNGNLYKTEEEYEALRNKIVGYNVGAVGGSTLEVKYDEIGIPVNIVAKELTRQLRTKMLLDEIKKENPDMNAVTTNPDEMDSTEIQLCTLPELIKLYNGEFDIRLGQLSKEDAKQIAFMQTMDFVDKANLRLDRVKHPTKALNSPKSASIEIQKDSNMECIVSRGGKQLVATDVPVRVDDCFKNLESKKFRGKEEKNSIEFNKMMAEYDKACENLRFDKSDKDNLDALKDLKEAAKAYIIAKRKQKGHTSEKMLDNKLDLVMIGKEKGGRSIFTTQGRDRYEFAVKVMTNIFNLEKHYKVPEMQMENAEIKQPENNEIKITEQEINEIQSNEMNEL